MGLRMQPRNEKFFTLFSKAGSNVVESAAILMEFVAAPHERWAKLAKRMHDIERAGDDTTSSLQQREFLSFNRALMCSSSRARSSRTTRLAVAEC